MPEDGELTPRPPGPHDLDPADIFITGKTPKEQAKNLFIRFGLKPRQIIEVMEEKGKDAPNITTLMFWIKEGTWVELRKMFAQAHDAERFEGIARAQAQQDVSDEIRTRQVYANAVSQLMAAAANYMDFSSTPASPMPNLKPSDILNLSIAMKNAADIHFKAMGIADRRDISPEARDGVEIYTGQELPRQIARPMDAEDDQGDDEEIR